MIRQAKGRGLMEFYRKKKKRLGRKEREQPQGMKATEGREN